MKLGRNRTEQVFIKNETSEFFYYKSIPSDSSFIASTFPLTIAPYSEQGMSSFIPYDENPILGELFIQVMLPLQFHPLYYKLMIVRMEQLVI